MHPDPDSAVAVEVTDSAIELTPTARRKKVGWVWLMTTCTALESLVCAPPAGGFDAVTVTVLELLVVPLPLVKPFCVDADFAASE